MERNKNVTRLLRTYQVIVPCDCVLRHEMAFYPPSNLHPLAADLRMNCGSVHILHGCPDRGLRLTCTAVPSENSRKQSKTFPPGKTASCPTAPTCMLS